MHFNPKRLFHFPPLMLVACVFSPPARCPLPRPAGRRQTEGQTVSSPDLAGAGGLGGELTVHLLQPQSQQAHVHLHQRQHRGAHPRQETGTA